MKIDKIDKKIIYELEQNCRRSLSEIAKKVRISKQTLHYRIERLVKEEVITDFIAILNVAKLGLINHEVWIQLEEISEKEKTEFIEYLVNHSNTRWVATCGGKMDVAIAINAPNIVKFDLIWKEIMNRYGEQVKSYFVTISPSHFTYPRSHLVGQGKERLPACLGGEPIREKLDEIEVKILEILSKNAREPTVEIAQKIGTSENTVREKIKRLKKKGVIQTYAAIVQPSKLGMINFEILASAQNITREKEKELETYCALNPFVSYYLRLIGKFDLDIAFDTTSNEDLQKVIREFRSRFSDIIKEFEYVPILKHEKFDYFAGYTEPTK